MMFNELDKSLEKNQKEKKRSAYLRGVKSRAIISDFYDRHIIYENLLDKFIVCESLYNRVVKLRRRVEAFTLIQIPVLISIVLGLFLAFGFRPVEKAWFIRGEFLVNVQQKWAEKVAGLPFEAVKKSTVLYNEIVQGALRDITIALGLIVIIVLFIACLLIRLIYLWYYFMEPRLKLNEYELEIAQRKLNKFEKEILEMEIEANNQ